MSQEDAGHSSESESSRNRRPSSARGLLALRGTPVFWPTLALVWTAAALAVLSVTFLGMGPVAERLQGPSADAGRLPQNVVSSRRAALRAEARYWTARAAYLDARRAKLASTPVSPAAQAEARYWNARAAVTAEQGLLQLAQLPANSEAAAVRSASSILGPILKDAGVSLATKGVESAFGAVWKAFHPGGASPPATCSCTPPGFLPSGPAVQRVTLTIIVKGRRVLVRRYWNPPPPRDGGG